MRGGLQIFIIAGFGNIIDKVFVIGINYSHYKKDISEFKFYILTKSYKPIFIKMKREVMFLYGIGFNNLDHVKSTKEKE